MANLSLMDHYLQMEHDRRGRASRCSRATPRLGFLAAHTETVELQLLVTGVTYRHPGLLAKIVSTLDVLSGGRAALGIGAAWYEREHRALGVPFPPLAERFERLEETLQIVRQMWSDDDGPFAGPALPAGRDPQLARSRCAAAPADHDRWRRGEEDAAPGREVRRRLQPLRRPAGPGGRRGGASSTCCASTASARAPTTTHPQDRAVRRLRSTPPRRAARGSPSSWPPTPPLGVTEVHVMPRGDDPAGFVDGLGEHVVPRLADLA